MQLFTNLIVSLVQREVGFAQQNAEGLSARTADLSIIQNDSITIPHPLCGSSLWSCVADPHMGAFGFLFYAAPFAGGFFVCGNIIIIKTPRTTLFFHGLVIQYKRITCTGRGIVCADLLALQVRL